MESVFRNALQEQNNRLFDAYSGVEYFNYAALLLEGYKAYDIYYRKDGWEGLALAQQKLPVHIVTDLTMPGIDGFGPMEELKLDRRTKDILVAVVRAKDTTLEEQKPLNGHIEAVYQKGALSTRKFMDQVIHVLEESNEAQGGQI